ncbi:hypothetical protein nbrc107696_44540 [Gordonia spumicola]|uniref:PE family protein n=1 Tax=Gordonia spumicola TaxID=589161 RepID=A0A7I9VF62_9ACTN|nr:hypothetical protein [Gordonia spumicola]GEE04008.1 hypothetical protein nbrc107696_44540 [Gordonia spumicola]
MNGQVHVTPAAVEAFGSTSAALAAATAGAATVDAAQGAAMSAAFGLIGQEFLAAYACAQANHLRAVGEVAAVHAATAAAAAAGLAGITGADAAAGSGLGSR